MTVEHLSHASQLPPQWDHLAPVIFQQKPFLEHAEKYNPCSQRYYLLWEEDELLAGCVVYTLSVDILTFSRVPSPVKMTVIGLPASVSAPGAFGVTDECIVRLVEQVLKRERGLILGLNFNPGLRLEGVVAMTMLPSVGIQLDFNGFSDYLSRLRSPYRRRAKRILQKFDTVERVESDCREYSEEHHQLYLQILKKTPSKLEVLTREFFQNLPRPFSLTSYYYLGKILCWHITAADGDTLFFFFGGHDYRHLHEFHAYFNNLFGILREGVTGGYARIDFGQTAEIAKLKTGGFPIPKMMFLYIRNPLLNGLIRVFRPLITYHAVIPGFNVFQREETVVKTAP